MKTVEEKMLRLVAECTKLEQAITANLKGLGYGG